MKLSIIIPLHNESLNIPSLLLSLTHSLDPFYRDNYELILVNDNSTDSTPTLIESYRQLYPQIKTVHRTATNGFGNAIKSGLSIASGEILIPFMGDLSDDPDTIPRMVNAIDQGYDIAYGSRFTKYGSTIDYPIPKLISNRLFNLTTKTIFGLPHSDYTNAFKAYRRDVIDTIGISNLKSSGFDLTVEIPLKAHLLGYTSVEIPTTWSNRKNGKANLKLSQNATKYGFRLLQLFFSGLYLSLKDLTSLISTGSPIKLIIALILTILMLTGIFKLIPPINVIPTILSAQLPYVLLSLLLIITAFNLRSYRWQTLLQTSGNSAPFGIVHKNLVFGFFINLLVPARAGDIARSLTLKATTGIPASISLTTIVIERILDTTAITILLILSLLMLPATAITQTVLIISILIIFLLISGLYAVYFFNGKLVSRLPKYKEFLTNIRTTLQSYTSKKLIFPFLMSFPIWFLELSTLYFISKSIGISIPYFITVVTEITTALAQTVPVTIGSIGVYEISMTGILTTFNVPISTALSLSIIDHSVRIFILTVLGIIATVHIAFNTRNYFRRNK